MFQGKVTLKSPKSSERNAISLVDKAKPKAEIQVLKKRALYIPEQIISAEKCFSKLVRVNQKQALNIWIGLCLFNLQPALSES